MNAQDLLDRCLDGNVLAQDCPSRQILAHVTGRWGTLVMVALSTGTHRFSEVKRRIGGVSERMLAQTLQQLEGDGLVLRVAHEVMPPHVDYSLTPLGREVAERVLALTGFIETHLAEIRSAQAAMAAE